MNIVKVKQIKVEDDIGHSRLTVCECRITVAGGTSKVYFIGYNSDDSLRYDIYQFLNGTDGANVRIFQEMSELKTDSVIEFNHQILIGKSAASNAVIDEINFFFLVKKDLS